MSRQVALSMVLVAGCATTSRFSDRPVLWRDPDDRAIAQPKTPDPTGIQFSGFRDALIFPTDRALALDYGYESVNVNALDEVPDSSWWHDVRRAGLEGDARLKPRALTPDEITRGPFGDDPGPRPPYTIVKGKTIGSTPGLVVMDARGVKYMFKLDPPNWLGLNTSTEVVATRLAWAAGWLVPAEMIVDAHDAEFKLAPNAKTQDAMGGSAPMTQAMVDALFERTPREADGSIRVCAGRWLPGHPVGPWAYTGRRKDDPNDRIAHENRRDVRAFGVWAAWVNDIDTMENNTLDEFVGKGDGGHVVHYQQDVGGSFGQFAAVPAEVWMGDETYFMPGRIVASLFSLGFMRRTFDDDRREARRRQLMEQYPELGYFDDDGFEPQKWHPILDNPAFVRMTMRDRYWGAKQVVAFTQDEVRAAVALGHYAPATQQRLFEILWNRRDKIACAFLSETAPLDYFRFESDRLCFDDLWLSAGLGGGDETHYVASADHESRDVGNASCIAVNEAHGYHVVELGVVRAGERHPPRTVKVHYVATRAALRVVGIER